MTESEQKQHVGSGERKWEASGVKVREVWETGFSSSLSVHRFRFFFLPISRRLMASNCPDVAWLRQRHQATTT